MQGSQTKTSLHTGETTVGKNKAATQQALSKVALSKSPSAIINWHPSLNHTSSTGAFSYENPEFSTKSVQAGSCDQYELLK